MTTRLVRLSRYTGSVFAISMLSLNLIAGCGGGSNEKKTADPA